MLIFRFKVIFQYLYYCLYRPHNKGHGIHSPFLYAFLQKVIYAKTTENDVLKAIAILKQTLTISTENIFVDDFGAGSKSIKNSKRSVSQIATTSSINNKYGQLLHKTVLYFKPQIIIELGTCLGIGSMYLASGNEKAKIITIEGSKVLTNKAIENFAQVKFNNITAINSSFDDILPTILGEQGGFDLIYIDGNHKKTSVLHYFNTCLLYRKPNSIIIIDDIRWSEGMYEAWLEICNHSQVNLSIDLFRIGIVFLNSTLKKQNFMIYY